MTIITTWQLWSVVLVAQLSPVVPGSPSSQVRKMTVWCFLYTGLEVSLGIHRLSQVSPVLRRLLGQPVVPCMSSHRLGVIQVKAGALDSLEKFLNSGELATVPSGTSL